jgi:hypothetical protein
MEIFGIIILRHVSKKEHNSLWTESYKCARKIYPTKKIIIIDDNSDKNMLSTSIKVVNCEIINSEYPGRGELLPYLYILKYKWFINTLIIHDSVFINKKIEFSKLNNSYIPLWSFDSTKYSQHEDQKKIISSLENNSNIIKYHNNKHWKGIFGGMTIINTGFLENINMKHNLFKMTEFIKTRHNRMSFERVIACILHYNNECIIKDSYCGDIYEFLKKNNLEWGQNFESYTKNKKIFEGLPFIKVWSGR